MTFIMCCYYDLVSALCWLYGMHVVSTLHLQKGRRNKGMREYKHGKENVISEDPSSKPEADSHRHMFCLFQPASHVALISFFNQLILAKVSLFQSDNASSNICLP